MIVFIFKGLRKLYFKIKSIFYTPFSKLLFNLNGVKFSENLKVLGPLKVIITRRGRVQLGKNLRINSGENYNIIGRQQRTILWVEGELNIGDNVGMSATAIICNHKIEIGNNVIIGGNTVIYDTDFHSLDFSVRGKGKLDKANASWGKVTIRDNVFIGAHSTILKGVTIGENSIVGACSVISKSIPENEVWAGNPARFIRKIHSIEI